jgi:hypothetical protein
VDNSYTLTADTDFYAKWISIASTNQKIKAVFYDDGIEVRNMEEFPVNYITLQPHTRNGYSFNGWKEEGSAVTADPIYRASVDTNFTSDFELEEFTEINSVADLENISLNTTALSARYKLMKDIDLGGVNWIPIGSSGHSFTGIFEGNGKKITGLTINAPANDHVGFFGYLKDGARIANLTVELADAGITGKTNAGGIAGYVADNGSSKIVRIVNSHTKKSGTGGITALGSSDASGGGGIVGYAYKYVTIIGCSNEVAINSSNNAGGIVGNILGVAGDSKIYNSWNIGNITASASGSAYAGGIVGNGYYTVITNSYNTGEITSSGSSSTFAGGINGDGSNISDSYNTGVVHASGGNTLFYPYAGGITGSTSHSSNRNYNKGAVSASSPNGSAYAGGIAGILSHNCTNSYNTGTVSANTNATNTYRPYAGGIAGSQSGGIISGNYNTGDITATSASTGTGDVYSGGITGRQDGGEISGNYNTGDITASSASTGDVYAAGIVGYKTNTHPITNNAAANSSVTGSNAGTGTGTITINRILAYDEGGTIDDNFAFKDMNAIGAAFGGTLYKGIDKTEAELKTLSTYSADTPTGLGWKFGNDDENPWKMPDGGGYPLLYWQTD